MLSGTEGRLLPSKVSPDKLDIDSHFVHKPRGIPQSSVGRRIGAEDVG